MITLISICCIIALLYYAFTRSYNYWPSRNVPYEKPFLIFGCFYDLMSRKMHISEKFREFYNNFKEHPYVGIYVFNQPSIVIRDPELIKNVMVKHFDKFVNRKIGTNEKIDPIAANVLFSAKDQNWKNLRSKISPVFTSGKMKLMYPLMQECVHDLVDYLNKQKNSIHEMRSVTKKFAVDIISSCAFGINAYCLRDENSELLKVANKLIDTNSAVRNFSILCFFFVPQLVSLFRLTFLDKSASDFLQNVFYQTIKSREEKHIVRNDLVDILKNLRKNENSDDTYKFDDIKLVSQALAFFSAGNDTTSLTISFALYELALNQDIQDRLRDELNISYNKHGDFTYDCLQEIKYLDMVFNETLRKYPAVAFLNREALSDYTIEETGLTLEKGTSVYIPVAGLHMDPKYFPNPTKFDPERFSDENKTNIVPYTYLPFGDGPRNCIGARFGILASKIALAYCIKNFIFERCAQTVVPMKLKPGSVFPISETGYPLNVRPVNQ